MKAIVNTKCGPPDVLLLEEIEKPTPRDDEVLMGVCGLGKCGSLNLTMCCNRLLLSHISWRHLSLGVMLFLKLQEN